jgi:hypothetical protein
MDPERAAGDLAEADERLRRGAALVVPRWWVPVFSLLLVVQTAVSWDMPASRGRGVLLAAVGSAMLLCVAFAVTRARARPLRIRLGWRASLPIGSLAVAFFAVMMALGLALRSLEVALPFTLSGILMAVALALFSGPLRRWKGSYVERVGRGQW